MTKKLLLFGPSGNTGRAVLSQALDRGYHVIGAEPNWPRDFPRYENFEQRTADLLNDDLSELVEGCDAVISAVGLGRGPQTLADPPPLYTEGAVRIVEAMRHHEVRRLVVISAAFAQRDPDIPAWFRGATLPLRHIFRQMAEMERVLRVAENIEWTAVRPGWLLSRDRTGDFAVRENVLPEGTLRTRRPDLAQFMLDCLETEEWVHKTPSIARKESAQLEGPSALIEEFLPF
ncbi:SDR family oxidoreductase [Altererythrobacter sp.]|nr:SDR family oxidoreductase [Altererythrobacter sp.]